METQQTSEATGSSTNSDQSTGLRQQHGGIDREAETQAIPEETLSPLQVDTDVPKATWEEAVGLVVKSPFSILDTARALHTRDTRLSEAQARIQELEGVLGVYADHKNWHDSDGKYLGDCVFTGDLYGFSLAQQALKE